MQPQVRTFHRFIGIFPFPFPESPRTNERRPVPPGISNFMSHITFRLSSMRRVGLSRSVPFRRALPVRSLPVVLFSFRAPQFVFRRCGEFSAVFLGSIERRKNDGFLLVGQVDGRL